MEFVFNRQNKFREIKPKFYGKTKTLSLFAVTYRSVVCCALGQIYIGIQHIND